jgi:hypothetical protein
MAHLSVRIGGADRIARIHALGQTGDCMADIYERESATHGIIIVTPVYWYYLVASRQSQAEFTQWVANIERE